MPSLSLSSLFRLRPLRDPGPNISGGSAGQTYPSTEEPGDAEPRRPVGHHIHQAAAQTSWTALAQQHALRGTTLVQSAPLKSFLSGYSCNFHFLHTHLHLDLPLTVPSQPPPFPCKLTNPVVCLFLECMKLFCFFILFLWKREQLKMYCIYRRRSLRLLHTNTRKCSCVRGL